MLIAIISPYSEVESMNADKNTPIPIGQTNISMTFVETRQRGVIIWNKKQAKAASTVSGVKASFIGPLFQGNEKKCKY